MIKSPNENKINESLKTSEYSQKNTIIPESPSTPTSTPISPSPSNSNSPSSSPSNSPSFSSPSNSPSPSPSPSNSPSASAYASPSFSSFKYIEDDQLSKNFIFCDLPENKTLKIHFCLFSINTDCFIEGKLNDSKENENEDYNDILSKYNESYPFLQFICHKNGEQYDFPSMDYECIIPNTPHEVKGGNSIVNEDIEDDSNKSQEQIHFENECLKYCLSIFKDENSIHKNNIDLSTLYKGFLEGESSNLFVFIDISNFIHDIKEDYLFCIIDEILYKKKIYDSNINPIISNFFKKNRQLTKLHSFDNMLYPIPFQLYLCEYKDESYININKNNMNPYKTMEHSLFSRAYYFTSDYLNDEPYMLKRFSCFIVNCLYVLDDINTELTDEEEKQDIKNKSLGASTIYFHENEIQLWGIKNNLHFLEY